MLKVYQIIPNQLFLRGRFFKYSEEEKLGLLYRYGIRVVVNLIQPTDEYLSSLSAITYIHMAIPDSGNAKFDYVEEVVRQVVFLVKNGQPALVHCNAGRNRSALVCAMVLMDMKGMAAQAAIDWMRAYRANALATEEFCEYLHKREKAA